MRLLSIEKSAQAKVIGFEGGKGLQAKLIQYGLYPGDTLRVIRIAPFRGPLLIEVNGREIALGRGIAEKIIVEVIPCASR